MAGRIVSDDDGIRDLLASAKVVAVVGVSPDSSKDSHQVAEYLKRHGYRIIPVNPGHEEILGERSYPDLTAIPERVDIVDVFRRPEHVPDIADQAISIGAGALWLQLGITHDAAAGRAAEAGLLVIQDQCIKVKHHALM